MRPFLIFLSPSRCAAFAFFDWRNVGRLDSMSDCLMFRLLFMVFLM